MKAKNYFCLAVTLLTILLAIVEAQNYCRANHCNGKRHIACNNNGTFSRNCGQNTRVIPITQTMRNLIVNNHNRKRNQLAGGRLPRYKPARRMASMQWNNELARLAVLNVKQCAMRHDACRSTKAFPFAGQNLAFTNWFGTTKTVEEVINQHIQLWWDEHKFASMAYINSYKNPPKGSKQIGHFTQMAQERATHVGCGIVRTRRGKTTYQYMACNYAMTNIFNEPVYRRGITASLCRTGRNTFYKNLCKRAEFYNVKKANY